MFDLELNGLVYSYADLVQLEHVVPSEKSSDTTFLTEEDKEWLQKELDGFVRAMN